MILDLLSTRMCALGHFVNIYNIYNIQAVVPSRRYLSNEGNNVFGFLSPVGSSRQEEGGDGHKESVIRRKCKLVPCIYLCPDLLVKH
jgi:hypothetical protein